MALVLMEKKATQAAASFMKLAGGPRLNYMSLIKYLYLLDRAALLRWGRLVTFDYFLEMKLGPVLSEVHDLITEMSRSDQDRFWTRHISSPSNWCVSLLSDPGDDELSQAEMELIEEIFAVYGQYDNPFDLADLLHKTLPELKGISQGSIPITIGDILRTERKPTDQIEFIEKEIEAVNHVHTLFSAS